MRAAPGHRRRPGPGLPRGLLADPGDLRGRRPGRRSALGAVQRRGVRPGRTGARRGPGRPGPAAPARRRVRDAPRRARRGTGHWPPGSRPICASRAIASGARSGTHPRSTLEKPAVVLGTAVVVLADLAPGASATVDLRAQPDAFGRALSERIFGQQQFTVRRAPDRRLPARPGPAPARRRPDVRPLLRLQRHAPSRRPGPPRVGPAGPLRGDRRRPASRGPPGETLYYLPLGLTASGPVTFTPDLMRSSLVEVKAQFFNKDPFNLTIGGGRVTLAYRPIPVAGRLAPTRLALGVNMGVTGPIDGGGRPRRRRGAGASDRASRRRPRRPSGATGDRRTGRARPSRSRRRTAIGPASARALRSRGGSVAGGPGPGTGDGGRDPRTRRASSTRRRAPSWCA